jgi:TolB-like protein/Tfp pilus assembly protein PilF
MADISSHRPPEKVNRLVVLPLRNISPDPNDEYFADGMTEELISTLSKIPGLRVIARTSAMKFKGLNRSVAEIRKELDVSSLIEGSVRKSGNKVRISAQLVDADSEEQLWSADYDRELADVFAIQRDIAQRILRALKVHLRSKDAIGGERPSTEDLDAYTLYLQGRFHWNRRNEPGLRTAIGFFERALEKDRTFALALTGLADSYAALALMEIVAPTDAFPRARRAAEQALKLDPNLAEAHTSLGLTRFQYERDWSGAEQELKRGIELNPNYPPGHQFYADYLKAMGRFDEAVEEMQRALEMDPLSLAISTGLGHVLYLSRQYDASIAQYRKALEIDPSFVTAHLWFGRPYLEKGMFSEAIAEVTQAVNLSGRSTISLAVLGHAYASAGRTEEAQKILEELLERSKTTYLPSYWIGLIYTGLGDSDEALAWLERAYEQRSSWLVWIKVEPRFDPLRKLPRFQSLLKRMQLGDPGPGRTSSVGSGAASLEARRWLEEVSELPLSRYCVVGSYARYEPTTRNALKDLRTRIVRGLESPGTDNFLLWAAPGSGKTFFVREISRILGPKIEYIEINLAEADETEFREPLQRADLSTRATLLFIDEVDAKPGATWPYELLLPVLEPVKARKIPLVAVLAGSGGSSIEELQERISARQKGSDLISRIPATNRAQIPPLTPGDRAVVTVSSLNSPEGMRPVTEIEKIALYYLMALPEASSPRQLRAAVTRALARKPLADERLKYDHLFEAGDPQNKQFWNQVRSDSPSLIDTFITISH